MPIDQDGKMTVDLSQDNLFYRPQIQLDCQMIQHLVKENIFTNSPITVADIGVREGFDRLWDIFSNQCLEVGFEPDTEECQRIKTEYQKRDTANLPKIILESIAVWENIGTQTLYIPRTTPAASCLVPNHNFYRRLPDPSAMEVVKTIQIQTTTLDNYYQQKGISFDVIKLDVQGGELAILKGSQKLLETSVLAVVAEVEFVELYENQPLFADIDQFMRQNGFGLFDLDIRRWRRKVLPLEFDGMRVGQTVYGDALYLRDPIAYNPLANHPEKQRIMLLKLAALAEFFSLPDYAIEIIELAGSLELISVSEVNKLRDILATNKIVTKRDRSIVNVIK